MRVVGDGLVNRGISLSLILYVFLLQVIYNQFLVFLFIDILRNAADTLSRIILILSIVMYIRSALVGFEDGYRDLKSLTFTCCQDVSSGAETNDGDIVIVKTAPYEPLYLRMTNGEVSIPRRIFYDIVNAFMPYKAQVISTLLRLTATFGVIVLLFALITKFNIFNQFTNIGDSFLTVGTVMLPALLGMTKSATHQALKNQRRETKMKSWLNQIITTHKVNVNLDKTIFPLINVG